MDAERGLSDVLEPRIRFLVRRRLVTVQSVEETSASVIDSILREARAGSIQNPAQLISRIRELIAPLAVSGHKSPSNYALETGSFATCNLRGPASEALSHLSCLQFEVLQRFYAMEQSPTQICEAMGLSKPEFRALKSEAKKLVGDRLRNLP